jgi:flavin-dependent dehydrogenase
MARQMESGIHLGCPGTSSLWGGEEPEDRSFIFDTDGPGFHIDRNAFEESLMTAAAAAGAEIAQGWHVGRWHREGAGVPWNLQLTKGEAKRRSRAHWIIDATGRAATIASSMGSLVLERGALVAFCAAMHAGGGDRDCRTFVESVPEGWWYSALLPLRRRVVAFFTDRDLPAAAEARRVAGFLGALRRTRHIPYPRRVTPPGRIQRLPAGTLLRSTVAGDGWNSIGDASLAMDPISSQGLFHALYTGLRGAECCAAALAGDETAVIGWQRRMDAIAESYLRNLSSYYGLERRWAKEPFWKRRVDAQDVTRAGEPLCADSRKMAANSARVSRSP